MWSNDFSLFSFCVSWARLLWQQFCFVNFQKWLTSTWINSQINLNLTFSIVLFLHWIHFDRFDHHSCVSWIPRRTPVAPIEPKIKFSLWIQICPRFFESLSADERFTIVWKITETTGCYAQRNVKFLIEWCIVAAVQPMLSQIVFDIVFINFNASTIDLTIDGKFESLIGPSDRIVMKCIAKVNWFSFGLKLRNLI